MFEANSKSVRKLFSVIAILTLFACGGGGGGDGLGTPPASTPPPVGPSIPPLGSPRVLVSNSTTLAKYRSLLTAKATSAVRFKNMVDAQLGGADYYGFSPWYAALMGQITGTASYCTYAVAQTEAFVASEEALIRANQRAVVAGDSYLEVGPFIGNLALVYDWCRSSMTTDQRTRWVTYANQAVWNVWHPEEAQWGNTVYKWSGWSIDNPANNYYYSFLEATMLLGLATVGENAQAQTWLDQFRTTKIENQLVPTFNRDLVGGGSREGTGYGTAMKNLWRLYDWWERSTGEKIANRSPHTLASMAHLMHSIVPTLDKLTPTGDHARDSSAALFDYHRDYLQVLMRLYPDERLSGTAKSLLAQSSVPVMRNLFMLYSDFMYDQTDVVAKPLTDLSTAYFGSGTGQFSMRSDWTKTAAYANFICGPYTESHAHRDQGSFTFYKGNWLAYDANIDSRSGIAQDETLHNLVRIEQNGSIVTQNGAAPCQMRALADTPLYSYGSANITPVYGGKSQVVQMEREFVFIKPATLIVFDRVQSAGANTSRIWTLNLPERPTVTGDTMRVANGGHTLDITRLAPTGLSTRVAEWSTTVADMNAGYRADVADSTGNTSQFLHVLSADSAVTQAVRADATGLIGTAVTLADGRRVVLHFNTGSAGGKFEFRDASGNVVSSGPLPSTVQPLSLFVN
jgi:hypothetical protein